MKTLQFLLAVACVAATTAGQAHAQHSGESTAPASATAAAALGVELQRAATGTAFSVGTTGFRLAPAAIVRPAGTASRHRNSPAVTQVGDYEINLSGVFPRTAVPARANAKLAAAVSDDGVEVIVTSTVLVFFDDADAVRQQARATGGTVTHLSRASGTARIEYASVETALEAQAAINAAAGIRGTEPGLIQWVDRPLH